MRRPCKYAQVARAEYDAGTANALQLIQKVWDKAREKGSVSHVVQNATTNFSLLTKQNGKGVWISWQVNYKRNLSDGLWPWLDMGVDIIEEDPTQEHKYRIRAEFYDDFLNVI
jgi:hypothetical protein